MLDGVIYDCPIANCRTPIFTGKCREDCIKKYNKEIDIKPQTNGDRIRAMSDEEIAEFFGETSICDRIPEQSMTLVWTVGLHGSRSRIRKENKMIEKIAQFLTDLMGFPVDPRSVIGILVVLAGVVIAPMIAKAWCKSGEIDWDAVEAERRRLEDDY